jgi:hypothetical protein
VQLPSLRKTAAAPAAPPAGNWRCAIASWYCTTWRRIGSIDDSDTGRRLSSTNCAVQRLGEAARLFDHLAQDAIAIGDPRHVEQEGDRVRRQGADRFGGEALRLLVEQA